MVIENLKEALKDARKTKNQSAIAFFSTLVGECDAVGKEKNRAPTDIECLKVMKKSLAGVQTCIEYEKDDAKRESLIKESSALTVLIDAATPTQLTQKAIEDEIKSLFIMRKVWTIGDVMKHFSQKFEEGTYNSKDVVNTFKELYVM